MNAAIYVRISEDKAGEKAGVTRQRKGCRVRADETGSTIVAEYEDNDVTASARKKQRPAYNELIASVEAGNVDQIIVFNIDRLYRKPLELEHLIELVEDGHLPGGIQVCTASELDLNTVNGRLAARILVSVAKGESERTGERIQDQQQAAAAEGKPHGGRIPIGYAKGMIVKPSDAARVREAAESILDGGSLNQIAKDWNRAGFTTRSGKQWQGSTVRDALSSPSIAGLRVYRGNIVGAAQWDPILDRTAWNRLQALFTSRTSQPGNRRKYLLSGLLTCGECGHRMKHKLRTNGKRAYACPSSQNDGGACGKLSTLAEPAEQHVSSVIVALLSDPANIEALRASDTDPDVDVEALEARVEQIGSLLSDYGNYLSDGTLPVETISVATSNLEDERRTLQGAIAQAIVPSTPVDWSNVLGSWEEWSVADRRGIVEALTESITVEPLPKSAPRRFDPDRISIVWS